jgi:hypothetical protein
MIIVLSEICQLNDVDLIILKNFSKRPQINNWTSDAISETMGVLAPISTFT